MKKRVFFIQAILVIVLSIGGQLRAQTTSEETFPPMPWAKDAIDSIKTLDSITYHKWGIIPDPIKYGSKRYNIFLRAGQLRIQRNVQNGVIIDTVENNIRLNSPVNRTPKPKPANDSLLKGNIDEQASQIYPNDTWERTRFFTALTLEPAIAVNPNDDRNIISACLYSSVPGSYGVQTKSTQSQGVDWYVPSNQQYTITYDTNGDPSVTFDAQGRAYVCYMDFEKAGSGYRRNKIVIDVSTNEGSSWTQSDIYADNDLTKTDFNDKPWITCDITTGRPYSGTLYAVWTHYSEGTGDNDEDWQKSQIWLSYKRPNGNWQKIDVSDILNVDQGTSTQRYSIPYPAVDADGNLYVFWRKSETTAAGTTISILMKKSIDGGQTFGAIVTVDTDIIDVYGAPMNGNVRAYTAPSVVATQRNFTNYLYVAYAGKNGKYLCKIK